MTKAAFSALPGASDRIELMQTFVRIVEAGSLSAAAVQLGATQPTVSRRLQALERSLGMRLLQRSTHAMKLTDDGERCFERAKALLANWEVFESDLRGAGEEPEGTLRVVAPHAFGQEMLVGPLAHYLRAHPHVTVEWLLHDRAPDFIADGIDCAIQVGELVDPALVAIRLSEVPRVVVAAPSLLAGQPTPQHATDLAALPWLALRTFYRTDILLTHAITGESCRLPIRPRMSTDSLYATRSAALLGLGVAVVSAWAVADDLAQGRLLHLVPRWHAAPLQIHLVYPYARFYPAKLRRFIDLMRHALPQGVDTRNPLHAAGAESTDRTGQPGSASSPGTLPISDGL
ncbi:LysR family transcriptional regulator [Variovorax ginsengisoli]|uniref:DNA-binding transcriptional LysR family regulator n=1 Tax=Variovorax ginsengisoli TaxID=363844 RepID=A0ABT9S7A7_9BURK|nr:LysR family transcriptional regulator [Variovorax ginsengisoli]MDP9899222.1 DNA-binding transcriptional LysR family regulator [Variovorax ginsengisoli]